MGTDKPRGRFRWWLLAAILALSAGGITFVRLSEIVADWARNFFTLAVLVLTALLLAGWLLIFSGFRWYVRVGLLVAALLVVAVGVFTLRVEEYDGDLMPRLTWSWLKPWDYYLPQLAAAPVEEGEQPEEPLPDTTDFPGFLGPGGRNLIAATGLASDWFSKEPEQLWRHPIGAGWSAFAVVGRRAFTQEQRGDTELVVCYDLETGEPRWSHGDRVRFSEKMGGDGPRATPTVVDGRVYTMGATGLLYCFEEDGKVVWRRDVLEDAGHNNLMWAKSCSPLVVDNFVVVTLGDSEDKPLAAYDRASGKPVWRGGDDQPSYATPVLATLAGRRQILCVNQESVTAHDPADGRILWKHPWPGKMAKCSQPVPVSKDRVFLSAGYGIGAMLLRVTADGDTLSVSELWKNKHLKTRFTNVVVRGGFVYGLDDGVLECLDLADGQQKWKGERYGHGQVLGVGDKLLVQAESGEVAVVEAGPDGSRELLRFAALDGKTWNNAALAGRYLLVRNAREAACYVLPTNGKGEAAE